MKSKAYIGTSGWSYVHWKGTFYPEGLKASEWLKFYAETFKTVEINSTFYHMPKMPTIKNWQKIVPKDFIFAIKASRYITHRKKLNDCKESVQYLMKILKPFKDKLGPLLFQLPPSFKMNLERLEEFISYLKKDYQYVFEFRHSSWFVEEVYELLSKNKIGLCITDLNGKLSPQVVTTNFTYLRLHGPKKAYQGSYGSTELKKWNKKINKWLKENISVYCYFDNDEKGYAIKDAKTLSELFIPNS